MAESQPAELVEYERQDQVRGAVHDILNLPKVNRGSVGHALSLLLSELQVLPQRETTIRESDQESEVMDVASVLHEVRGTLDAFQYDRKQVDFGEHVKAELALDAILNNLPDEVNREDVEQILIAVLRQPEVLRFTGEVVARGGGLGEDTRRRTGVVGRVLEHLSTDSGYLKQEVVEPERALTDPAAVERLKEEYRVAIEAGLEPDQVKLGVRMRDLRRASMRSGAKLNVAISPATFRRVQGELRQAGIDDDEGLRAVMRRWYPDASPEQLLMIASSEEEQ